MNQDILTGLVRALETGDEVALVTIVAARGSTPQRVGAKMLVFADGRSIGTIGGGCYENDAALKARAALTSRQAQLVNYDLADDFVEESGLICGGQMQVFIEPIESPPRLYVVGAGHVAQHLARSASQVGFRVSVVDDREKFANRERFPDADTISVESIPDWLDGAALPPHAYVAIVTRGHRHDLSALRALAPRELRYVGLIGSKAKVSRIYAALLAEGVAPEALARVHAPIGLDIGAVTPEEIAASIVAELVAVRRGRIDDPHVNAATLKWKQWLALAERERRPAAAQS